MRLTIVDVFAEAKYAGNQLAVVEGCAALSDKAMQDIAREMNFSETTFVVHRGNGRAGVRIFTPEWELPFAGHPAIGTAWVLAEGRKHFTLDLKAGPVQVGCAKDAICWLTPPPAQLYGEFDRAKAAELIGLAPGDLDAAFPVRLAEVGPKFVLVGVTNLDALKRAHLNAEAPRACQAEGAQCVFVFSKDAYAPDGDYAARMFFRSGFVREDPATGSANTAFAAYLQSLFGPGPLVVVDQGVEMKRPSRLYLRTGEPIQVGGKVRLVARGELV